MKIQLSLLTIALLSISTLANAELTKHAANGSYGCRRSFGHGVYNASANKTVICWNGENMSIYVREFDHSTQRWSKAVKAHSLNYRGTWDYHNYPCIALAPDGQTTEINVGAGIDDYQRTACGKYALLSGGNARITVWESRDGATDWKKKSVTELPVEEGSDGSAKGFIEDFYEEVQWMASTFNRDNRRKDYSGKWPVFTFGEKDRIEPSSHKTPDKELKATR